MERYKREKAVNFGQAVEVQRGRDFGVKLIKC